MEVECTHLDRISILPQSIIAHLLTLMPIGDALRTSILSKKWRYKWATIPKLCIDHRMFRSAYTVIFVPEKIRLMNAIFHILLLHMSQLLEFTWIIYLNMSFEIDQILLYLSRNNSLQRLRLANCASYHYKLPESFFSFQNLELLALRKCAFKPPLTFKSFSTLKCLCFDDVEINTKSLKRMLTNCPQLEELYLFGKKKDGENRSIAQEDKLTFVEFFKSVPLLKTFAIEKYCMEHFGTLDMPPKLPISLVHLKTLCLGVSFMEKDELLRVFCFIKSSPNLTNFTLENEQRSHDSQSISMDSFDLQEHSNFKLDHLYKLEMQKFSNLPIEIDFVKLIVTQAPVLKKVRIELNENFSVDEELKIFKDDPFPLAPPSVKFVVERPKTSL